MSKQKMRVSYELCFDLMNALAGIAICGNGGCPVNEVGEPYLSDENITIVEQYVHEAFQSLMDEWVDDEHEWEFYWADEANRAIREEYNEER